MRRIVIDMQNVLFADAVAESLRNFDSNLEPVMSESPDKTLSLCDAVLANVLIMEVTVYTSWTLEERLKIRNALKKAQPDCKIVLVVDGQEGWSGRQFYLRFRFFQLSLRCH